jgi:hypothetical protein
LIALGIDADPLVLELAATAAFLAAEGEESPWDETVKRKPEDLNRVHLEQAKQLYKRFQRIATPKPLPEIVP